MGRALTQDQLTPPSPLPPKINENERKGGFFLPHLRKIGGIALSGIHFSDSLMIWIQWNFIISLQITFRCSLSSSK